MHFLHRLLAALLLLLAFPALAQSPAADGAVRGVTEIAGKLVPLPPGAWVAVGEAVERHGPDQFATRTLARIDGNVVDAMVIVRANLTGRPAPLAAPAECDRDDIHLAYIAYDTTADGLCLFVNHVVLSDEVPGPAVWLLARERLAKLGAVLTDTWLVVGVRARTTSHAVDVRYYFAPPDHRAALPARGWIDSRWAPDKAFADGDRRASIRRLAVWAVWTREAVELGLRGQIPDEALPPAPWDGGDLARRLMERRVAQLDRLLAQGAIGADEYRRQRRILEAVAVDPELSDMPLWRRGLWKRVTHRLAAAAEALGVSYLVLGSLWPSLGFTVLVDIMGPVGAYLQDLVWPPAAADARPAPVEFGEIGASG